MFAYTVRRLAATIPAFVAATVVIHLVTFALPGDPARRLAGGQRATPAALAAVRAKYRLDDPLPVQYLHWMGSLGRGDLGRSFVTRRTVGTMLAEALPVTLRLVALTLVIEVTVGVVWGAAGALRPGGSADRTFIGASTIAIAAPIAVVGSVLQLVLGVRLGWLPVAGAAGGFRAYLLPACSLALTGIAILGRIARSEVAGSVDADHVHFARATGVGPFRLVTRHVVRASLVPLVAALGLEIGSLLGGTVVMERVFNLPGFGGVVATAIGRRDLTVIIGASVILVGTYLVLDVLVDVATMLLDPRLRP